MNKYYAFNSGVSTAPVDGCIEINSAEHSAAVNGILNGLTISVDNGFEIKKPPKNQKYILNGELLDGFELPEGAEPYISDDWYISQDGKYLKKDEKYELLMKKQEILRELEQVDSSITARTLREAALGDTFALSLIESAEQRAEELRQELEKLE